MESLQVMWGKGQITDTFGMGGSSSLENRLGLCIRRCDPTVRIAYDDPVRKCCQRGLQGLISRQHLFAVGTTELGESFGHAIESLGELPELVNSTHPRAALEVSGPKSLDRSGELADRP